MMNKRKMLMSRWKKIRKRENYGEGGRTINESINHQKKHDELGPKV